MSKKNIFFEAKKLGAISAAMGAEIISLSEQEFNLHKLVESIPSNEENRKIIRELTEIKVRIESCYSKLEEDRQAIESAYDKIIITLING